MAMDLCHFVHMMCTFLLVPYTFGYAKATLIFIILCIIESLTPLGFNLELTKHTYTSFADFSLLAKRYLKWPLFRAQRRFRSSPISQIQKTPKLMLDLPPPLALQITMKHLLISCIRKLPRQFLWLFGHLALITIALNCEHPHINCNRCTIYHKNNWPTIV